MRDVEQMLEQFVAPIGGRFAVEGCVATVEKDAARRVLGLRLGGLHGLDGEAASHGLVGGHDFALEGNQVSVANDALG